MGKLIHLTNGISHGRKFTSRLLASLRAMKNRNWTTLSREASLDIRWFIEFAAISNGISFFGPSRPTYEIECDACLTGAGGHSSTHYYTWQYSPGHHDKYQAIHKLEAINLLVAYKTLAPENDSTKLHIQIYTDNISSAFAIMSGRTKDETLAACSRQMWLEAAWRDQTFTITHKPGAQIELADGLSRFHTDTAKRHLAETEIAARGLTELEPILSKYVFFHEFI